MSRHRRWTRRHLDALLQVADPLRHSMPTGDGIETALDAIGTAIAGSSPRMRRPNRRRWNGKRRTALLLGAAALVIGAGVATGAILRAHTGRFPAKPEQAMGGPFRPCQSASRPTRRLDLYHFQVPPFEGRSGDLDRPTIMATRRGHRPGAAAMV